MGVPTELHLSVDTDSRCYGCCSKAENAHVVYDAADKSFRTGDHCSIRSSCCNKEGRAVEDAWDKVSSILELKYGLQLPKVLEALPTPATREAPLTAAVFEQIVGYVKTKQGSEASSSSNPAGTIAAVSQDNPTSPPAKAEVTINNVDGMTISVTIEEDKKTPSADGSKSPKKGEGIKRASIIVLNAVEKVINRGSDSPQPTEAKVDTNASPTK